MPGRKLPIGIQTFREIREEGCYYVDKTPYIRRLVGGGKHYFLSRPRRFGKSLFVDTLKELFEGSEALFEGLAIHDDWNWSARHPVLRLDFSRGDYRIPGYVHQNLMAQLEALERRSGVASDYSTGPERFNHLLEALHERTGRRVVVLVDEYDKPILDALDVPEVARANRDYLRGLYSTVKFADAHVRFTFLTGVSKFSKVSLFSGLNNLTDITLNPYYSAICGYTDADLDTVFAPELEGLDRQAIRDWYNGYNWRGAEKLYNPFDILLLFFNREFDAYWFETGTPAFLVETLTRRGVSLAEARRHAGHKRPAVEVRRGRDGNGGAPVPDRLPHDYRCGGHGRKLALPAGLSEPGGAPEPERKSAGGNASGLRAPGGTRHAVAPFVGGERLRRAGDVVPGVLLRHPP